MLCIYQNRPRKALWGIFWMALGVFLLLSNYGLTGFQFSFSRDWPILLIAWGIMKIIDTLVWRNRGPKASVLQSEGDRQSREQILQAVEDGKMAAEEAARRLKDL
jgi:hypothetical protein